MVTLNVKEKHDCCHRCQSPEIKPYGHPEISEQSEYKSVQCFEYEAPAKGNLCPKCGNKTLSFELEMIVD